MQSPFSFSDDYASAFQQQIRAFREKLDMESKSEAKRVEDRISKLPDGVLHHILSFVPTKCSVRTSVLSTRWKDMWVRVPNLYLYDGEFSSPAGFMEFVDRALLLRDSAVIKKFHLYFDYCHTEDLSRVHGWLKTAVRCNVVELVLCVVSDGEEMLELPESLLTCQTLEALKLESDYSIKIPTTWSCPKLKFLYIQFMYPDYESMDFSQFPALEHLSIVGSLGNSGFRFNISVPELKTLWISLDPGNDADFYNFLINAPKLEKLDISEGLLSNYTFRDTNSIAEASVDITTLNNDSSEASANRATKFLAGISSVKCLTLSSPFSTACSVPEFENLTKLMLLREGHWWTILTKFLDRSPNLESFDIHDESLHPAYRGGLVLHLTRSETKPAYVERLYWSPPESVPKCLLSSLKTITIKGFKGKEFFGYRTEMELLKYLLESCLVLEKMTVYTPSFSHVTPEEFYNAFPESERGSRTVQVELIAKEFYAAEGFRGLRAKSIYTNV